MILDGMTRADVIARSLLEQARADVELARAIVTAAACVEAAEAYGASDPVEELERRLGAVRSAAREALGLILLREGAP